MPTTPRSARSAAVPTWIERGTWQPPTISESRAALDVRPAVAEQRIAALSALGHSYAAVGLLIFALWEETTFIVTRGNLRQTITDITWWLLLCLCGWLLLGVILVRKGGREKAELLRKGMLLLVSGFSVMAATSLIMVLSVWYHDIAKLQGMSFWRQMLRVTPYAFSFYLLCLISSVPLRSYL